MIVPNEDFNATTATIICSTTNCKKVILYLCQSTVATNGLGVSWIPVAVSVYYKTPDPTPDTDNYIYPDPINIETIKFWREQARKESRYRNIFEHRPLIKRRTLNSRSGWLAKLGRLRKKGKK